MHKAVGLYLQSCKDLDIDPAEAFHGDYQLDFKIDAPTFINYYSGIPRRHSHR